MHVVTFTFSAVIPHQELIKFRANGLRTPPAVCLGNHHLVAKRKGAPRLVLSIGETALIARSDVLITGNQPVIFRALVRTTRLL
jgi:hypothetical protein